VNKQPGVVFYLKGGQMKKKREHRGDYLMNWFLEVFNGRKAPFPRKCFKAIACLMEEHLASGGEYAKKYKKVREQNKQ
jgi:hypothetical protein